MQRKEEKAMRLLCWLGIHHWELSRELSALDAFPPFFIRYETPIRRCKICGKQQRWLPGYGGSEPGCWITEGKEES